MQPEHRVTIKPKLTVHSALTGGVLNVRAELRINLKTTKASDDVFARLDALANKPETMQGLLREVALQSLIERYQKRFLQAEDRMTRIETMRGSTNRADANYDHGADERFIRAKEARIRNIDRRSKGKSPEVQAAARRQIENLQDDIDRRLEGRQALTGRTSSGGLSRALAEQLGLRPDAGSGFNALQSPGGFRNRMKQVYAELFTKPINIPGSRGVGFGEMTGLTAIRTPSHTNPTTSPYSTMWKQLEFGTGVFAVEAGGPLARTTGDFKEADGSWWYGRRTENGFTGLHFKGTRPGSWYRTPQGAPYPSDTFAFMSAFYNRLLRFIRGQ